MKLCISVTSCNSLDSLLFDSSNNEDISSFSWQTWASVWLDWFYSSWIFYVSKFIFDSCYELYCYLAISNCSLRLNFSLSIFVILSFKFSISDYISFLDNYSLRCSLIYFKSFTFCSRFLVASSRLNYKLSFSTSNFYIVFLCS